MIFLAGEHFIIPENWKISVGHVSGALLLQATMAKQFEVGLQIWWHLMKGLAPYHAFTEIGNASEAKKLTRGTGHAHGPLSPSPRTARDTCAMAWVNFT
ncbi:hypothetical protein Lal_00031698 [Lupinus albus]|nr:hypothetical protein Lal_00031698 [Lupinus albus]